MKTPFYYPFNKHLFFAILNATFCHFLRNTTCFLYKNRLLWRMVVLVILMLMVPILEIPLDLYVINCTAYSPEVFLQQYPLTMPLLGLWNFIGLWLVSYFLRKRRQAVLHCIGNGLLCQKCDYPMGVCAKEKE